MKVILLKDIKKVGRRDEVVEVADGYAQNVLLRQGVAVVATPKELARLQKKEVSLASEKAYTGAILEKQVAELDGKVVNLAARSNDVGTLFSTIHVKEIQQAVQKQFRVSLPESAFECAPLKKVGEYPVSVRAGNTKAVFTLVVG